MPKKKPDIADQMLAAFWGTSLRKAVTALSLFAGSVTATAAAWATLDLPVPASRIYVHEYVKPVQFTQAQQAVAIDRFLLYQLQESLDKAKRDPAANTSPVVQERIRELDIQVRETSERIRKSPGG